MSVIEKAILLDDEKNKIKENKKIKDFADVKKKQELFIRRLRSSYNRLGINEKTFVRLSTCGDFCMFLSTKNFDKMKLYKANFCKNRFCPACARRKAIKDSIALMSMTRWILEEKKRKFIYLTLTVPSVSEYELREKITEMNKAFERLFNRKQFNKAIKGYARKLEVSYNKKTNTFNPHFHILISVCSTYFKNNYIRKDKWLNAWREVMKDSSITQIDIKNLTDLKEGSKNKKELLKIVKYIAKDNQYNMSSDDVFVAYYKNLKSLMYFSFSGDFREARTLYSKKELNKYLEIDETTWYWLITFGWAKGEYQEKQKEKVRDLDLNIKDLVFKDCL